MREAQARALRDLLSVGPAIERGLKSLGVHSVAPIQELAGHKDLTTTQRYMRLNPSALDNAIRLLEGLDPLGQGGDIVETAAH